MDTRTSEFLQKSAKRHAWHVAINKHHNLCGDGPRPEWKRWMYEGKTMSAEVPRLAVLFKMERLGELSKLHKQCSMSPVEAVDDNHLTCCLGTECRKCEALLALDQAELAPEEIDHIKAWTCAAHIVSSGGDPAGEGYILTTDDRMFWDTTYHYMSMTEEEVGEIEVEG